MVRRFHNLPVWIAGLTVLCASRPALALTSSQGPAGANLDLARTIGIGAGVKVGILDVTQFGLLPTHQLGSRLEEQVNLRDLSVDDTPLPIVLGDDPHETLVANTLAGEHPTYRGTAPGARVYVAAVGDDYASLQAASAWLSVNRDNPLLNLSGGWEFNGNGESDRERYFDWLARAHDVLVVKTSGNNGGQINDPGGFFNGITVGMFDEATQGRHQFSSYLLSGSSSEARGKPEILAPGVAITDGVTYGGVPQRGTSFAAPHVTGTAAVLMELGVEQLGGMPLGRLATKALILNGARKRTIAGPQSGLAQSFDFSPNNHASRDRNYLAAGDAAFAPNDTALTTQAWNPTAWSNDGTTFTTTGPLDDEQGTGLLDTSRSVINLLGGRQTPGTVSGIGWDIGTLSPAATVTYAIAQAIPAGNFLTATLVWDRIIAEDDADNTIELLDTYSFQELANLNLRLRDSLGTVVAQSISTTDNLEHLHVPLTSPGSPGDYSLEVAYNGGGVLPTEFAIAWWVGKNGLSPGDYNYDGVVDTVDYNLWRASFGQQAISRTGFAAGDGNGDGIVDAADWAIWRDAASGPFGTGTLVHAVPEPATVALAALAMFGLLAYARK
ncbi:MAG: S8 family serine peptidase [Pirellulales bacterium]